LMRLCGTILIAIAAGTLLSACALFSSSLPKEPSALASMEEPTALLSEPEDELQRAALDPGSFTGIEVADARASLDALLEAPDGLAVARVVENSPAEAAGIMAGDLLYSVRVLPDGEARSLAWTSEWREVELNTPPGSQIEVSLDRAGAIKTARIDLVVRVRAAERRAVVRLREEQRAGVVVRAPTEVEARSAGLAPGAGALLVGLSADSPWRQAGLRFEDLIVAVDGERISAPDVLIERIRTAPAGAHLELDLLRGGESLRVSVALSKRAQDISNISIPLLFSYEYSRHESETSVLLGLFNLRRTPVAWSVRLLWIFSFSGGDADRLEEVKS
jgi:C-terminal processing protease CtpA/Prc